MSGPGVTQGSGVVEDSAGNVYVSGSFTNSVTLSTGQVLNYSGNGTFLMKLAFAPVPATKFYVVDDASANRTYEYDASGGSIENYSLNGGDSAPRGAATTAVGDKVWVVDANRKVYVYDNSGGLLGSWTAGSLSSKATPEGIATDGTDVWIVDSKSDKVYKYAGAASRLSGSQNATSSFSLNGSNTSPKDIVTDGSSLWVVNDSSTDKVFKYTTVGRLCRAVGRLARRTRSRRGLPSTLATSATSGSSIAAPISSTSTPALRAVRPAVKSRRLHSR